MWALIPTSAPFAGGVQGTGRARQALAGPSLDTRRRRGDQNCGTVQFGVVTGLSRGIS